MTIAKLHGEEQKLAETNLIADVLPLCYLALDHYSLTPHSGFPLEQTRYFSNVEVAMTRIFCSVTMILLLTASASSFRNRLAQQNPEDEVLAQGNPPLTLEIGRAHV